MSQKEELFRCCVFCFDNWLSLVFDNVISTFLCDLIVTKQNQVFCEIIHNCTVFCDEKSISA